VPDPFEELTRAKARLEAGLAKERSQNCELATWRKSATGQGFVRLRTENEQLHREKGRLAEIVAEAQDQAMEAESKLRSLQRNLSEAQGQASDAQRQNEALRDELAALRCELDAVREQHRKCK
jgi:chromosome segregation ATPase